MSGFTDVEEKTIKKVLQTYMRENKSIKDASKSKLVLYSLLANGCSFGISLLIHYL